MILDFLHTDSFGLCLLALLVPQGLDLVALGKALDEFGPEFARTRLLHVVLVLRTHPSNGTPLKPRRRRKQASTRSFLGSSSTLRIHHEPLVLLLSVVLLQFFGSLPVDIITGDCPKIGATVSLDNDEVSRFDVEPSPLLDVEDVSSSTFEEYNVQELVVARLSDAVDVAMRRRGALGVSGGDAIR